MELVEEDEPTLQPTGRRQCVKGDVALVFRQEIGSTWTSVLYIREHLVDVQTRLDDFVTDESKTKMYVTGPPGCGKTCFCLQWARRFSVLEKKRVFIIQFREYEACWIWIREANGALHRMKKPANKKKLDGVVERVIEEQTTPFDLCVHDGVIDRLDVCKDLISILNVAVVEGKIKKVIHITSLAFSLSTGGQNLNRSDTDIAQMNIDSWSENDYQEALRCQDFLTKLTESGRNRFEADIAYLSDSEQLYNGSDWESTTCSGDMNVDEKDGTTTDHTSLFDVLKAKYFFAGGSARFMFQFELEELRGQLDERLQKLGSTDWISFAQGQVSSRTPTAVNTLMQQFSKRCTPLSRYVLFCAYDHCKEELVKSVRAAANAVDNPALKGWAFELEQIELIRSSLESPEALPSFVTNGLGFSFRPLKKIDFDSKIIAAESATIPTEGTVIWCLKWNQRCFDAAYYQDTTLITLQFTVSEEHTLKPAYIRKLRDAMVEKGANIDNFVHVSVSKANGFQFEVDTAGTGRQGTTDQHPDFTINACHSVPLSRQVSIGQDLTFQAKFPSVLEKVPMWPLATTKKRKAKSS